MTKVLDLRRGDHRQIVASLELPPLTCTTCGEESEFDDLPELYFQHSRAAPLPNPPAIANLIIDGRDTGQVFNIEKHIADTVTGVWLSGSMDRAPYFKHLADGLQGEVVIVAADVDSVTDDGLNGFTSFLCAPGLTSYLARVPPVLVNALAEQASELGATKIVTVLLPCFCSSCHRDVYVEIGEKALRELSDSNALDAYCPDCAHGVIASPPPEWLQAVLSLPMSALPDSVASYLEKRPRGPSETTRGQTSKVENPLSERYKILKRLGSGGMGDVFLARRLGPAGFEKMVVIKRIRADRLGDDDAVEAFVQEAKLSARLSHPNVVQIFDLGTVGDEYFLTMEYVDGLDLRTIVALHHRLSLQIPIEICCRIISDLCQALHAAHTHRDESGQLRPIIHRDVSPGNILISRDGIAKLTDFGIAKVGGSDRDTKSGVIKGTMRYIPPEVLRGPRSKVLLHPRIDVYGAGVLLYECLTGRALFSGDGWVHTLRAILRQSVPKLSKQREGVSPELERVFEQAVNRDQANRYQRIRDFQRDLESAMHGSGRTVSNSYLAAWVQNLIERKSSLKTLSSQDITGTSETDGDTTLPDDLGNRANSN
ncbi:MAG: serine/threonine protein kinase [Proteobacteria bacterium]|nr:serine/threonine protein kinase [Pseudomonadota bacterium]